jgi:hypothetical protein
MKTTAKHYTSMAVCMLFGMNAWAGPEIRSGSVEMPQASVFRDVGSAVVNDNRRQQNGQVLRCWQEGRLLYEGSGFRSVGNGGASTITLPRSGDPDVILLDLKQGLCILTGK